MLQRYSGIFFVLFAAWGWAQLGIFSKFLLADGVQPLEIAFWRTCTGAALFGLHAVLRGHLKPHKAVDLLWFIFFGVAIMAGLFTCYPFSVRHNGAALASVLLYTAPAWVAVLSRFFFAEPLTPTKITAVVGSLIGVACVSLSGGGTDQSISLWGLLFGMLCGLGYSALYVFTRFFQGRYPAVTLYAWSFAAGSIFLFPFVDFAHKTLFDWLMIAGMGVLCGWVSFLVYYEGLKRLGPVRTAVISTSEPFFAVLTAWAIWGESFSPLGWAGAGLILGAVLLSVLEGQRA